PDNVNASDRAYRIAIQCPCGCCGRRGTLSLYIHSLVDATDDQLSGHREVAARIEDNLRREVGGKSRIEHFHFVLAGRQSFENKIAIRVRSGHVNGTWREC